MSDANIETLKANIDKKVQITTSSGEEMVVKVISVFDQDSDADMFFELVATSQPRLYARKEKVGGYSITLNQIVSVKAIEST